MKNMAGIVVVAVVFTLFSGLPDRLRAESIPSAVETVLFDSKGIRGEESEFADIADLRITVPPGPPTIAVTAPEHPGGLLDPDAGFRFQVMAEQPVEPADIQVLLNGEDVSARLRIDGDPLNREVQVDGLQADTSYHATIRARNALGVTERSVVFYTFREHVDGYRGIWFTLGQMSGEYGDKYSGGLAFCFSHTLIPMAIYAPEVNKTFFVYGGTTGPEARYLLIMASYYDHTLHRVPRPVIVRDQQGVDDPHDNPSISIDSTGHLWVFIAGRGQRRPGQIFRSTAPYSIDGFEEIETREQTYSQIWAVPEKGFLHLLTKYTAGRELYWETSPDGFVWSEQRKLAGFSGHYQVSRLRESKVGTAFNYHPGGSVDRRTNIYYAETADFGETWTTVEGHPLDTPLDHPQNPALVIDYEAQNRLAYVVTLLLDEEGRPVILYLSSGGFAPGPENDPRIWHITRWSGSEWITRDITRSDHNYDVGSLYIDGERWTLIAPALSGPQPYHTGGEVGLWVSSDGGEHWRFEKELTRNSPQNHSYVRRPHNPVDPFYAMWADGDSGRFSPSRLFFCNSAGDQLYMLPYSMAGAYAEPLRIEPPEPPAP